MYFFQSTRLRVTDHHVIRATHFFAVHTDQILWKTSSYFVIFCPIFIGFFLQALQFCSFVSIHGCTSSDDLARLSDKELGRNFILMKCRLSSLYKREDEYEILDT